MDLITPLPQTKKGNNTLLCVVDIMTKFVLLRPIKSKEMIEVTRAIWNMFSIFNGLEFVNQMVQKLTKLHGIDHRTIYLNIIQELMEQCNEQTLQ